MRRDGSAAATPARVGEFFGDRGQRSSTLVIRDAGFPEAMKGVFSDAMADELVISGNEDEVAARSGALRRSGIDELLAAVVMLGDDPQPAYDRTVALLGRLPQAK